MKAGRKSFYQKHIESTEEARKFIIPMQQIPKFPKMCLTEAFFCRERSIYRSRSKVALATNYSTDNAAL
jgi:hypothetical protein